MKPALVALCLGCATCAAGDALAVRAVNVGGTVVTTGPYRPPLTPAIALTCLGDSITAGYTTSNAPTTSWCNQAAAAVAGLGYTITVNNLAQTGSSSWEWCVPYPGVGNGFGYPASFYFQAGKRNVALIDLGTNSLTTGDIYGSWTAGLPVVTTTVMPALMGPVSAVSSGSSTTITLSTTGVTSNRNVGEYALVYNSGVTGLDGTCAQITGKTSTQLTLSIATSGATSSTGLAYVCTGPGDATNAALLSPTVVGSPTATGSTLPSWILAGGTTDGTVTWGTPISQAQKVANLHTDILNCSNSYTSAGYSVFVVPLLPRGNVGPVQTLTNQETQRNDYNAWLLGELGTNGIKVVPRLDLDPNMSTPGVPATNNTTYYTDKVHPNDFGSHYMGVTYGMQAILDALHP